MLDLSKLSMKRARVALRKKEFSARELTQTFLDTIKRRDSDTSNTGAGIHAYLEVFDDALEQADEADKKRANGEDSELLGMPVAIKDNMLMEGKRATAGSKILSGFVASFDST